MTAFLIYALALFATVIYPPILKLSSGYTFWDFVWNIPAGTSINIPYLLIEILVISLIYFGFIFSKKKK